MASIMLAGPKTIEPLLVEIREVATAAGYDVTLTHSSILDHSHEKLRALDAVVSVKVPLGESQFNAMPNLRAAISPITGYEWIDVEAATANNVLVANGEGSENFESMAEATIMLMLVSLYDLRAAESQIREMRPRPTGRMSAQMVRDKTIGIVGYGNIAQSVVRRLANWDVRILVCTRTARPDTSTVSFVGLDQLLEQSDVILVLSGLNAGSRRLLDAEKLEKLKPGCAFINTARGELVDEEALAGQIANGRVLRAALDVFEEEPLPAESPLRKLPNVVLTDHIVGHTREMYDAIPRITLENLNDVMAGIVPWRIRNKAIEGRWRSRWSDGR